jgi:hypothetical protein
MERAQHYAAAEPQGFDDAKDRLAALATVARNMVADVIEKKDNIMISGYPEEAYENDSPDDRSRARRVVDPAYPTRRQRGTVAMPFDATTFRQPTVRILPPQPPERGRGPQRIHIEIEIIDRRAQPVQRPRIGGLQLVLLLILLAMLFGRGHAQPTNWQSHQLGSTHYYEGSDQNGGQWNGSIGSASRPLRRRGTSGQRQHCERYRLGSTTYTDYRSGKEIHVAR